MKAKNKLPIDVSNIEVAKGAILDDSMDKKYKNKKVELRAYRMKDNSTKYKVLVWKRETPDKAWSLSRDSRRKMSTIEAFHYFGEYVKSHSKGGEPKRFYKGYIIKE